MVRMKQLGRHDLLSAGADPEGGGAQGGARPPVFAPNSLKSPLNRPKYAQKLATEPPAPLPFSNPGSAPGATLAQH